MSIPNVLCIIRAAIPNSCTRGFINSCFFCVISFWSSVYIAFCHPKWNFISVKMTAVSFILGHFMQAATRDWLHTELKAIMEIILQRIIFTSFSLVSFIKPLAQNLLKLAVLQHFHSNIFHSNKYKIFLTMCSTKKLPGKC